MSSSGTLHRFVNLAYLQHQAAWHGPFLPHVRYLFHCLNVAWPTDEVILPNGTQINGCDRLASSEKMTLTIKYLKNKSL
jgi:hypothetical protein